MHPNIFLQRGLLLLIVILSACDVLSAITAQSVEREVDAVAEFFAASNYKGNTTPLTVDNLCKVQPALMYCAPNGYVVRLNFSAQSLTGTLSASLARLQYLSELLVTDNQLTGSIPPEYSEWGDSMSVFDVSHNRLSGTLPASLSNWSKRMMSFKAAMNRITGTIPATYSAWGSITNDNPFMTFDVSFNRLNGTLPRSFGGGGAWPWIREFLATNNQLSGTLPEECGTWTDVFYFDVSMNNFTGTLPRSYSHSGT